jgi:CRISPR-associated protein Csx10
VKQLALKVTTLSPLSIRSDHSPTGAEVAPYIPGSTLMGCLISAHRLLRRDKESELIQFFLSNKVQYPNLYPASFENSRMQNAFSPLYCIPRTAQTCKRFKGFLPLPDDEQDDEDERHGVRDSLFDWAIFTMSGNAEQAVEDDVTTDEERGHMIAPLQESKSRLCTCGEPLDSFDGFYRWGEDDTRAIAKPETRLLTRTGINRKYGIVEAKILYSREVYEEETCFFGVIQAEDDIATDLQNFIWDKGSAEDGSLLLNDFAHLGTSRTRGFGRVAFEMEPWEDFKDRLGVFKERLRLFDKALRDRAQAFTHAPLYIALTLHAPTILYDELLRYEGIISGERLAVLAGLPADTFKLLYHSASMRRIMGWQELWGLPRMEEYAIDAGSVFLFAVTRPLDDTLARTLCTLEEQGIGQRRAEGFGRICVSDPFHREENLR